MSFRTGLLPHLVRATHARPTAPAKRLFHFLPNESQAPRAPPPNPFRSPSPPAIAVAKSRSAPASRLGFRYYAALGLGLSIAYNNLAPKRSLQCQSAPPPTPQVGGGNPPQSILSVYELGFGTVCGICTGVFLKKGLRAIAFLLGGVFVLLQVSHPARSSSLDGS